MPSSSARSNGSPRRVNSFGRRSWTNGSSQTSKPCARCSRKLQLPLTVAQRREVAVVGPVEELPARRLLLLALEVRQQVVAVEVDLVVAAHGRVAREQLLLDVGLADRGQQRRQHVLVREHVVVDRARLDHARPSDQGRNPVAAFPLGVLLAAERRRAAVRPAHHLGAVVGRVHHDGVVGDAELVELVEQLPDHAVVLDHAIGIDADAGDALGRGLEVGPDVHPGGVPPQEERLARGVRPLDEVERALGHLHVDRLHPLLGQRAGVLDRLRAVRIGDRLDHAARAEPLLEGRVLRIVGILRLLLGVQVVEVAEELVEAVIGRHVLVEVAEVVLAVLAGHVAVALEQPGDRRVLLLEAEIGARQPDLGETGAHRRLAGDERRPPGGAALLPVPVGEQGALARDPVDVRRPVAHHAEVVGADVVPADVVAPDHQDVGLLLLLRRKRRRGQRQHRHRSDQQGLFQIRHLVLPSLFSRYTVLTLEPPEAAGPFRLRGSITVGVGLGACPGHGPSRRVHDDHSGMMIMSVSAVVRRLWSGPRSGRAR